MNTLSGTGFPWPVPAVVIVSAAAVFTDIRWRRVPNWLTIPAALFGVAGWTIAMGYPGSVYAIGGGVVGTALLAVPWRLGWVGGGDLKFLAAVGALGGAPFVLRAALAGAVLGGLMALVVMVQRTPVRRVAARVMGALCTVGGGGSECLNAANTGQTTLPYAVALAGGVFMTLVTTAWGWW